MSSNEQARIRLAEARGWVPTSICTSPSGVRDVTRWRSPSGKPNQTIKDLPDPFTDANDDYAVLEWMRESHLWQEFKATLHGLRCNEKAEWRSGMYTWSYEVGDYARAALKVIEGQSNE